ncbi:unnamed protein product, partial [Laminaria digitata]
AGIAACSPRGGDATVDLAVAVGKALIDVQRQVLRKLCASVYPDFQASSSYEHLCDELTTGAHSPPRLPPGPPYRSAGEPPLPDAVTTTTTATSAGSSSSAAVIETNAVGEQSSEQAAATVAVTPSRLRGR